MFNAEHVRNATNKTVVGVMNFTHLFRRNFIELLPGDTHFITYQSDRNLIAVENRKQEKEVCTKWHGCGVSQSKNGLKYNFYCILQKF